MIQILCQGGCAPEPPLIFKILSFVSGMLTSVISPILLLVSLIFLIKWFIEKKSHKEKKNKLLKRSKTFFIISLATFWLPIIINILIVRQDTVGHAIIATGKILGVFFFIVTFYYFVKWLLELIFKKGTKDASLKRVVIFFAVALLSVFACHLLGNAVDSLFPNDLTEQDGEWVTCWCG